MMQIDHELVTVLDGIVLMGVAVRLVAFMALVLVLMMLIVHVPVLVRHRIMPVQKRQRAFWPPERCRGQH